MFAGLAREGLGGSAGLQGDSASLPDFPAGPNGSICSGTMCRSDGDPHTGKCCRPVRCRALVACWQVGAHYRVTPAHRFAGFA